MKIKRIYSWNPLGKVAREFDKSTDKWANRFKKVGKAVKGVGKFVVDKMDKEDIQNFVTKQYGKIVKVGNIKKVDNPFGGMYKWFGGIPVDKQYEGGYVFRNGNDIRLYPHQWNWNAEAKQEVLDWFDDKDEEGVAKFR